VLLISFAVLSIRHGQLTFLRWLPICFLLRRSVRLWESEDGGRRRRYSFPILVGFLLDYYKDAGNLTAGYNIFFTVCGATYIITYFVIHLLTRRKTEIKLNDII